MSSNNMMPPTPPNPPSSEEAVEIGVRLREARIQAGLGLQDVASKLKMQVRIIEALEAGNWERLGAPVFVRGQLRSYVRLLGLPADLVPIATSQAPIRPPQLVPMTYTPPLRRVAEKLMGRMVYVVITGLIVVPVWMATRSHLSSPAEVAASLDMPTQAPDGAAPASQAPVARPQPTPLVASMALPRAPAEKQMDLTLHLNGDSWVQVFAPDGAQIEQGLLKAGEQRRFAAGQVGRIVLGNAGGVEVRRNGDVQDLSAYQRANVARFTVSSDGSLGPVSE
ncbi:RodZ domain-containing protein [Luteimonas sp. RIT-PG2_3]